MKKILTMSLMIILFTSCTTKKEQNYNKPALFWYNKMVQELANDMVDEADDTYTSLESEHRNSPHLSPALLILANVHMLEEEYELANYYYEEHQKKFGSILNTDYVEYLKIKAKYKSFKQQFREQNLLDESLNNVDTFLRKYPRSDYSYLVLTIRTKILLAKASLQVEIADLYKRKDKPKASEVYMAKAKKTWSNLKVIDPVSVPWYRAVFE